MMGEDLRPAPSLRRLSPRQEQILQLVASGLGDKEIAVRLGISPRTIQSHLNRLFLENGFHKRAAAVAAWLRGFGPLESRQPGVPSGPAH
jgi:DNA-binding CsgD family transcriptional regulator